MTKLKLCYFVERTMYHARQTFQINLPFVNSMKSLTFDLINKDTTAQTFSSYSLIEKVMHYQTDTIYRVEIEL